MTQAPNESGFAVLVTLSAVATIGAGLPVNMIGVLFSSNATANQINVWTQSAASVTGNPLVVNLTGALNTFVRIPAYCPQGLVYNVPNDHVNLTIFWCPAD